MAREGQRGHRTKDTHNSHTHTHTRGHRLSLFNLQIVKLEHLARSLIESPFSTPNNTAKCVEHKNLNLEKIKLGFKMKLP